MVSQSSVAALGLVYLALSSRAASAFGPSMTTPRTRTTSAWTSSSSTTLAMLPDMANNLLLATIDADIANIPNNEFQTVFVGGLGVMAGGLLSAVAVGAILEASDGYAAVVAESYDLEADEQFWKGLNDEEAKKAREMIAKVKAQRGDNEQAELSVVESLAQTDPVSTASDEKVASSPVATPVATTTTTTTTASAEPAKEVDMFSDY